jgi:hypothetical protein
VPSVNYGAGAYKRDNGNLPPLTLINMFVESAKTSEGGVALLSRNGLGLLATNGSGPINGLFSKKGTLSGDVFSISGTALYRGTSAIASGTIAGSGVARFAGSDLELVVTRGTVARSYIAAGIANIAFPDSANVTAVTYIGSLFVFARASSAKFYWSTPLDGRTIDPLDFATAEREPDWLLDIEALGDNLWLFGQQSVEAWAHTGDADLPFTRLENVAFDKGIHSTGCVVPADNSLFFVGSDRVVYRVADVPQRVSDHGVEERILASTACRLFAFKREGHEFVAVRLDSQTFLYDCATQEWCEFQSSGGQWIVSHATMQDKVAYFGHQTTGELMGWDEWDDMGEELERRFTFAAPLNNPLSVDRIHLWCNAGQTELLSGQGSSPIVEIRLSDDAGNTWDDWEGEELGVQGAYRQVPEWRALGMFDFPGLLGECRVTDPVPFRVSAIKVNDPAGGRQRV